MNIKLIKFSNGMYGIRRGLFFYEYLSIEYARRNETGHIWWKKKSEYFGKYCMTDYEDAKQIFDSLPIQGMKVQASFLVKDKVIE